MGQLTAIRIGGSICQCCETKQTEEGNHFETVAGETCCFHETARNNDQEKSAGLFIEIEKR